MKGEYPKTPMVIHAHTHTNIYIHTYIHTRVTESRIKTRMTTE